MQRELLAVEGRIVAAAVQRVGAAVQLVGVAQRAEVAVQLVGVAVQAEVAVQRVGGVAVQLAEVAVQRELVAVSQGLHARSLTWRRCLVCRSPLPQCGRRLVLLDRHPTY